MDFGSFGGGRTPPTRTRIGRLKYDTRATAQKKADALGLDGTHSHKMKGMNGGERFYMPGTNHKKLNKALKKRGMRPTPARENGMGMGGSGGDSSMMSMGSPGDDSSMLDMGDSNSDSSMLGMADRDRDRPSAFDQLGGDRDRDRGRDRRGTGLGDLAVGAVGLGLGLGALDALDDAGGETDGRDIDGMDMDLGGFDG
jgi:hypothetical protein